MQLASNLFRFHAFFGVTSGGGLDSSLALAHTTRAILFILLKLRVNIVRNPCRSLVLVLRAFDLVCWSTFFFIHNALLSLISFFFIATASSCGFIFKV